MATRMDGKALAAKVKQEVKEQAEALRAQGIVPGLAVVIVGDDPASRVYVNHKRKDCAECMIESFEYSLPAQTTLPELLALIEGLNADPSVHGILVQMPLPAGLDEQRVLRAIDPAKDVDAFHPENVGGIMLGTPRFLPCTPAGVMELLDAYGIDPKGKRCVVVGRSNIVGKPQAMLLLHRHGTVTICHSRTPDLGEVTRSADILVCAVGKIGLITADMVKEGATVIDVAMNVKPDGKLTGDVVYAEVEPKAAFITPVPGGVGPMTRAGLLRNTIRAAQAVKEASAP